MSYNSWLNKQKKSGSEPWRLQGVAKYREQQREYRKANRLMLAKQQAYQVLVDKFSYSTKGICRVCATSMERKYPAWTDETGYSMSISGDLGMGHTCSSCRITSVPLCMGCSLSLHEMSFVARKADPIQASQLSAERERLFRCLDCAEYD